MTVNPGFGHQHFIHAMLPKIQRVRRMIDESDQNCDLEVDGGIDSSTAPLVVDAGANVLVAGTAKAEKWLRRWTDSERASNSPERNRHKSRDNIGVIMRIGMIGWGALIAKGIAATIECAPFKTV